MRQPPAGLRPLTSFICSKTDDDSALKPLQAMLHTWALVADRKGMCSIVAMHCRSFQSVHTLKTTHLQIHPSLKRIGHHWPACAQSVMLSCCSRYQLGVTLRLWWLQPGHCSGGSRNIGICTHIQLTLLSGNHQHIHNIRRRCHPLLRCAQMVVCVCVTGRNLQIRW